MYLKGYRKYLMCQQVFMSLPMCYFGVLIKYLEKSDFLLKLNYKWDIMNSVQFSCSVVSNSLRPHELQHARPPCPSPTPGVHPNPCTSSQWCHPIISSPVVPFSSCPQFFPASGSLPIRWPKYWSFSFSISPSNEYPGLVLSLKKEGDYGTCYHVDEP